MEAKEIKKDQKVVVMAGTYHESAVAKAKEVQQRLAAAELKGFAVKPAAGNYIMVCKEVENQDAAKKLIEQAANKKIKLCIAK